MNLCLAYVGGWITLKRKHKEQPRARNPQMPRKESGPIALGKSPKP